MSALLFLTRKRLKNRCKELVHHPGQLLLVLFGIAIVVMIIVVGPRNETDPAFALYRPRQELNAIIFLLYAAVFVLTAKGGFVNGASMFSMADVNLLFTAPAKSRTLLFFGLFSQMGRSLLMGLMILYQFGWAHQQYGITVPELLMVLLGYAITVFLSQMLAMLIYSFTAADDRRCRIVKAVFWGVILAFAAAAAQKLLAGEGELLTKAVALAGEPWLRFFPVAGFVQFGVVGAMDGAWLTALAMAGLFVLCIALYLVAVSFLNDDFYEDVLKATEVSFSAVTARKEGKAQELAPRNVKVGKTGLRGGAGASAFYYKHLLENRRSRFFAMDLGSLIIAVITVAYAVFFKSYETAFAMSAYMMMINIGTGRWAKELLLPYAYLVPEPPFKKLVFMMLEQFPALVVQSLVTFIPFYFIFDEVDSPLAAMLCAARICFGWLFIGVNLLIQRIFGTGGNRSVIVIVYFLFCMLLSVPAVVAAVLPQALFAQSITVSFLAMSGVNLLLGTGLVFICRNVLNDAQLNNR